MEGTVLYSLAIGAWVVPLLSALAVGLSTRCRPSRRPTLVRVALAFIIVSALAILLKISFAYGPANAWSLLAGYGAYCVLAAACFGIRPLWLRIPALIVAALPVAATYLLTIAGVTPLILWGVAEPPRRSQLMRTGLSCDVKLWGMAYTDSGYEVRLRRFLPSMPFIWRDVAVIRVNQTASKSDATCETLLEQYDAGR